MSMEEYSSEGPKCPHCRYEITADEGYYYTEDEWEETCENCDKTYLVSGCVSWFWMSNPVPCTDEHDWSEWETKTHSKTKQQYKRRECDTCGVMEFEDMEEQLNG